MTDQFEKEMRKLKKVKITIMRNPVFAMWSGILMIGKTEITDQFPTAYTNGRDEAYGRDFVKKLSEKELAFIVLHENLHKAFRHMTTWQKLFKEAPLLCNAACDYVINLILHELDPVQQWIAMPMEQGPNGLVPMGLLDQRFKGMHTKQVFDILKQEQKAGSGSGSGDGPKGFDIHDWAAANGLSEEEKKELIREVDQALRQGEMAHRRMHGKGAGDLNRELGEMLRPQVDWKEALREFITSICSSKDASSWRRINRRFLSQGVYMPSLIGERIGRVGIGIDTSGSIGMGDLTKFLSEVKGIIDDVHPEKLDLLYWDTHVAGHEEYDEANMNTLINSTSPKGGGGTDPACVPQWFNKEKIIPECVVMLTDGCVPGWGDDWPCPVLWVICNSYGGSNIEAAVGKTVHLN